MSIYPQQEIRYADEDTYNDQADVTFDYLLPVLAADPTFVGGRTTDGSLQSKPFKTRAGYRTPRGPGQVTLEMFATGAGVDTATGALVHTGHTKLLADGFGGEDLTGVGGVAGASATSSSVPNGTGTRTRGAPMRVGQAADTRAEGQGTIIGNPNTALLAALPAAPNATDKLRSCITIFPKVALGPTKRFLIAFADNPGMQFIFTGCQLAQAVFRCNVGAPPTWLLTYNYAYWRPATVTTPSAATMLNCDAAMAAGGSYFLQTVGTATRPDNAEKQAEEIELTINLGLIARQGETPGLTDCITTGWVRMKPAGPAATLRLVHPYDPALFASWLKDGSASDLYHFLATINVGGGAAENEGRSVLFYAPNMFRIGDPMPPRDRNGQQFQESMFALSDGPDTTTPLTESFLRFGLS